MNMNTGKDVAYKDFIQNAIYHKKHILKIFGLTAGLYNTYVQLDYFRPTVRKSTEPGTPNLYSFDDLMRIYHFLLLLEMDIKVVLAAKIITHENSNDYPMSVCQVYGEDKPSACLIKGNIKFYPTAATESLCERIFKSIKLDELEQR